MTASAFAALGDPTRIDIVTQLSRGSATVSELAAPHDMSLRAVLKHVQVLEHAGLITTTKQGRTRQCELRGDAIVASLRWLTTMHERWEQRLDRLDQFVDRQEKP